ncbi:leucine repeat adapter protein 25 [Lingula anatina]|uniref:Leucine repeat adapter protein 25 n=1 Tax=Lingula anatina TaxID=7574 RepID=A0A1S3HL77_LINAN|nr:leucine repeat adapter protein 25-like [Lingula anatina]XP_013400758.1 leucine repeat adapter protein 25 [Lingula anatina]|eukprot:XP_013386858.1 leucine repeat adapter protein 25-like [Lingula anatina]
MASVHGLPDLPKCLSGLANATSSQWKEEERLHSMRAQLQADLSESQQQMQNLKSLQRNAHHNEDGEIMVNFPPADAWNGLNSVKRSRLSLDAAITQLRKEMVTLRQLDMSLLCQLWALNESIQDYKQMAQERMFSETNSECSYSHEAGLDTISDHDESDVEYMRSCDEDGIARDDSGISGISSNTGSYGNVISQSSSGHKWKQTKC